MVFERACCFLRWRLSRNALASRSLRASAADFCGFGSVGFDFSFMVSALGFCLWNKSAFGFLLNQAIKIVNPTCKFRYSVAIGWAIPHSG